MSEFDMSSNKKYLKILGFYVKSEYRYPEGEVITLISWHPSKLRLGSVQQTTNNYIVQNDDIDLLLIGGLGLALGGFLF